ARRADRVPTADTRTRKLAALVDLKPGSDPGSHPSIAQGACGERIARAVRVALFRSGKRLLLASRNRLACEPIKSRYVPNLDVSARRPSPRIAQPNRSVAQSPSRPVAQSPSRP